MKDYDILRLTFFIVTGVLILFWEKTKKRLSLKQNRYLVQIKNLGLSFFNVIIIKLIFPLMITEYAVIFKNNKIGIFNNIDMNNSIKIVLGIIILDLAIYFQHRLFHYIPLLWKLHMIHHLDLNIDFTTGVRFHPIEIIISVIIKILIVLVFGISSVSVLIFEIILNSAAMFNHGNIYIKKNISKILELFIITPDMHRVHHSTIMKETNSNYGFNISIWDRIFRTYKKIDFNKQSKIKIGIKGYKKEYSFKNLLIFPFYDKKIN